jgi:lipopolysaccharide export system protein LptA
MKPVRIAMTLAALMGVAALAHGAFAQAKPAPYKHNNKAQISIIAKGDFIADTPTCTTRGTGGVQVTQDRMRIVGETLDARQAKKGKGCGEFERAEFNRNVFYITPDETVRADKVVYEGNKNLVTFTGDVIVVRGDDVSTCSKLVINVKTNESAMTGPVHAVVLPDQTDKPKK